MGRAKKEIKKLVLHYQNRVDLKKVGFPDDWESLLNTVKK